MSLPSISYIFIIKVYTVIVLWDFLIWFSLNIIPFLRNCKNTHPVSSYGLNILCIYFYVSHAGMVLTLTQARAFNYMPGETLNNRHYWQREVLKYDHLPVKGLNYCPAIILCKLQTHDMVVSFTERYQLSLIKIYYFFPSRGYISWSNFLLTLKSNISNRQIIWLLF